MPGCCTAATQEDAEIPAETTETKRRDDEKFSQDIEVAISSPGDDGPTDPDNDEALKKRISSQRTLRKAKTAASVRLSTGEMFDIGSIDYKEYKIMMPKWFFHPAHLVFNLTWGMLLYSGHSAVPGATEEDDAPMFRAVAGLSAALLAPVFAVFAGAPRWSIYWGMFLLAILCGPVQALMLPHGLSLGSPVAMFIWTATVLPFAQRRGFVVAVALWTVFFQVGMIFCLIYAVGVIDKALAFNDMLQGLALPALALTYQYLGFASVCFILHWTDITGLPQVAFSTFICMMASTTESFRFCALTRAAMEDDISAGIRQMCVTCVANIAGELWKRWVLGKRIQQAVTGGRYQAIIWPERDVFNRTCFYVQYTVLPCFLARGLWGAFVTEVPWAQNPLYWVAFPVFILSSMTSDAAAIWYHRMYFPVEGESWWQGFWRLNVPGQSWPNLQNDGGKRYRILLEKGEYVDLAEEYAKSGNISPEELTNCKPTYSKHPFFTDELILAAGYMWGVQGVVTWTQISVMGKLW